MKNLISALILVASSIVAGQRPSFAGLSPIGFPATPNRTTTTPDPLGNRFGEAEMLPIEANGDRDLIDRLSKLPVDKQPFWFINWQAYDKHRKEPQTFAQKPNSFVDPIPLNSNSGQGNNGFSTPNPGVIATEPNVIFNRFAPINVTSQPSNVTTRSNFNNGGIVYPTSNVNPISHILPTTNVYDNSNLYTNGNSNSNGYPNSNSNSNAYPDRNSNWSVSPLSNPNSNAYPAGNVNPNNYPTGNVNPNNYPTGNVNPNNYPAGNVYPTSNVYPNNYPAGNVYPNNYPAGNVYPNNYPAGNVYPSNYPTGNPNSNGYHTSHFNSHSNTSVVNNTGAFIHTTQKYQWTKSYMTTKVVPTNYNNYPESYPRTDTHPQTPGHFY